ncbi:MAG: cytochrome d ubiquinol oxidase subunit II, partial [Geminicoccales bacterium]
VIVFAIVMYVLLDGFDLGVGILFPYLPSHRDRDLAMNSLAPIWDGNETYLVLGGAGLFGAFPLAYAVILPGTYLPLLLMLIALIFRGVAFEFRFKAESSRHWWDKAFHYGSVLATFAQGLVLGAFIQGFEVEGRDYAGGMLDWLSPFTVLTGIALVAGYGLLGATWLIWKTEGELQDRCYQWAARLLLAVLVFVGIVSLWTPFLSAEIARRWFSWPNIALLSPVPVVTALTAFALHRALEARREILPFALSMALFLLSFLGLGISLWPHAVPPDVTVFEAAAPPATQSFLLIGVVILLPFVLGYQALTYYVFRGKVKPGEGYH